MVVEEQFVPHFICSWQEAIFVWSLSNEWRMTKENWVLARISQIGSTRTVHLNMEVTIEKWQKSNIMLIMGDWFEGGKNLKRSDLTFDFESHH